MRTVGLRILKNKLSEYIRLVATGETVLVTDRDKVVAELRPPTGRSELTSDALLAEAMLSRDRNSSKWSWRLRHIVQECV